MGLGINMSKKKTVLSEMEMLESRNKGIMSIFSRTVADLTTVNTDMERVKQRKQEERFALEAEIAEIGSYQANNTKVIFKINEFLD